MYAYIYIYKFFNTHTCEACQQSNDILQAGDGMLLGSDYFVIEFNLVQLLL